MLSEIWALSCIGPSCNWAVANWDNLIGLHELYELSLYIKRVKLDFIDCWRNSSIAEHIPKHLQIEVGDANTFDQSFVN